MTAEKTSPLLSKFIIDGVPQELTPLQLLGGVLDGPVAESLRGSGAAGEIVDETVDPVCARHEYDSSRVDEYLAGVIETKRTFPILFSDSCTRSRIAFCLMETLWKNGHFRIGDIALKLAWKWNSAALGNMSAFYSSVQAAADYIDGLGIRADGCSYAESRSACDFSVKAALALAPDGDEESFVELPYRVSRARMCNARACPSTLIPDAKSWVVYIPFESSDYRLGGSLLAQYLKLNGGVPPQIGDADYFIDCYEVVRELVEDGIIISAQAVGDGGLLSAVHKMSSKGVGMTIDLSDIMKAFEETEVSRVLFAEVPGVIIQIRDIDFDYLDAELLLQDVAFFPLGHPSPDNENVRIKASAKTGIQTILESLMHNAEGED